MNILFLTLLDFESFDERNIYTDLLREFVRKGHTICAISPLEKRKKQKTRLIKTENASILKLQIGNIQKTNWIEKGISTVLLEYIYIGGIKKYFNQIRFDLILYSTPPITFYRVVKFVKKRDHAKTYLLLKDIFPQNAVDIGILQKTGIKSLLYYYFREKEKKLYAISDRIGCMSQANKEFVMHNNPDIDASVIEICPNSIKVIDQRLDLTKRAEMREQYEIPDDKVVFIYGGNLGKPQGISFIIDCLRKQKKNSKAYFLIVGNGTEIGRLQEFFDKEKPENMQLLHQLQKDDYDSLVSACDVGLIFLDYRFTIPNFPSRLLGYMQAGIPVLACTDKNTDIGNVIVNGGFGWWCESRDVAAFDTLVKQAEQADLKVMGELGYKYLTENYCVEKSYQIIEKIWLER